MLLALPVMGLYCSIGILMLGLIMLVLITVTKTLGRMQWNLSHDRKG
jgi:protein-S-isoprenylcysteine O-methyltransferase Ste14